MQVSITPERADEYGRICIVTRMINADGLVVGVHRTMAEPCMWHNGGWHDTDLSDQPDDVQAFARDLWTPELVSAFKTTFLPPPAPPYLVYRVDFVERTSPDEAALLEAALEAAEPKLRLMYQSVDYFLSSDPLFAVLHWTVASVLGTTDAPNFARADELLAAS